VARLGPRAGDVDLHEAKEIGALLRQAGRADFLSAAAKKREAKKSRPKAGDNDTLFHVSERLAATAESARR
jgi:hypothetical protein